jgi:hypothetical protein
VVSTQSTTRYLKKIFFFFFFFFDGKTNTKYPRTNDKYMAPSIVVAVQNDVSVIAGVH